MSSMPKFNTIMIVDDNPTNLEVLSLALTLANFRVVVALDGESAIAQAKYRLPDIILLDVMMPGIDGFETCRRLKGDVLTKDIPVIFMTALSETDHKVKGLSVGAVDYITKPFQQEEVLARIEVHLKLRNFAKTLEEQNNLLKQEIEQRERAETALRQLTQKLEQQKEELSQTLQHLQQTQAQLIHSEKMSSLGQLVAGVAHEINNPTSFIYGNIKYAEEYIKNLLKLLQVYQRHYPNPVPEVQSEVETLDLHFLLDDLPKLLDSMKVGAERIRQIVLSLRNFSRMDQADCKKADIHEGIENTLMILEHRLKAQPNRPEIAIAKKYGKLPSISCYPGQLNQVFMNILVNAIDALEDEFVNHQGSVVKKNPTINICTEICDAGFAVIHITDNGPGIPLDVQQRLFDPFFTTKPVGKGTGMGLSISYQIVTQKHGGRLECISLPGQGSEFIVKIPLQQKETDVPKLAAVSYLSLAP